jgi:UDP-glucuronate decarboxylase
MPLDVSLMTTPERIVEEDIQDILGRTDLHGLSEAKVLVAGAGMLGTYVALALSRAGAGVSLLVRGPRQALARLKMQTVFGDLAVGELPSLAGITHIVNCAGRTGDYVENLLATIQVNTVGVDRLIRAAADCQAFLSISSTRVYGSASAIRTVDETDGGEAQPLSTEAAYDESKRLGETLCYAHWRERGFPARIVRLSNVYGPLQSLSSRLAIPDFLMAALKREPVSVRGHRENRRNYCYIADAVAGIVSVLSAGGNGEAYNIAGRDSTAVGAIAEWIGELADCPVVFGGDQEKAVPKDEMISIDKARRLLNYEPRWDIREGLRRTYRWHLDERSSVGGEERA